MYTTLVTLIKIICKIRKMCDTKYSSVYSVKSSISGINRKISELCDTTKNLKV